MATLSKQQQINIFRQGKQFNPNDPTANAFLGDGRIDLSTIDPKIAKQRACFPEDGFIDERDTQAQAFLNPLSEQDYERVPEHIKKQMEQFTGSYDPSNYQPSARDFMENF